MVQYLHFRFLDVPGIPTDLKSGGNRWGKRLFPDFFEQNKKGETHGETQGEENGTKTECNQKCNRIKKCGNRSVQQTLAWGIFLEGLSFG